MISVKCPHCHVGLKVDEGKIPLDITSFKCPKCKQPIPVSLLS
ncbi:zinc-ribbon domain-containing protein, partial [uncultured Parabacteroides sp.]